MEQRCGNRHDAEDLTQQTLIAAYRALARFDCERPFAPWLFTIARRLAISHGRRRRFEALPPEERWPAARPNQPAEMRNRAADLWDLARRRLPERLFSILWFRYGEDMSVADAARAAGVTPLHGRVLLHRARRIIAAHWRQEET